MNDAGTADAGTPDGGFVTSHTVWKVQDAPNGRRIILGDIYGGKAITQDHAPASAGDLFGVFFAGADHLAPDNWYLLVSQNKGLSWEHLAMPPGPNEDPFFNFPVAYSLCQDSQQYRVHYAFYHGNANGKMKYHRIALTRDVAGHISGGVWEVENGDGPSMQLPPGGTDTRLEMIDAVGGAGQDVLVVGIQDYPNSFSQGGTVTRYRIAKTTPAIGLAPRGGGEVEWTKLDGSAGLTTVAAWRTDNNDEPGALNTYKNVTDANSNAHSSTLGLAQHPLDRSLHFFTSPRDTDGGGNIGIDLHRWRFMPHADGTWAVDPAQQAVVIVTKDGVAAQPEWGYTFSTQDSVWLAYFHPRNGIQIDRVMPDGSYSNRPDGSFSADPAVGTGYLPSPLRLARYNGMLVFSVSDDQRKAWIVWQSLNVNGTITEDHSAAFDGTSWIDYQDSYIVANSWGGSVGFREGVVAMPGDQTGLGGFPYIPWVVTIRSLPGP